MKRLFGLFAVFMIAAVLAFTASSAYALRIDQLLQNTKCKGVFILPQGTDVSGYTDEGSIAWDSDDDILYIGDGSSVVAVSDNTLDDAYDQGGAGLGAKIDADSGVVEIEVDDASDNGALLLDMDDVTNNPDVLTITNAGTGNDITGDTWSVGYDGAAVLTAISAYGSGDNANLTIDAKGSGSITLGATSTGNIIVSRTSKLNGDVDIGDAATDTLTITAVIDGNVTLDDGVTASPSLIFKDATDETATLSKADAGVLSLTTDATDGFNVLVGNLWVGNGSPGVASMNGEDAYIEGQLEVDGTVQLDGALTAAANVTLDDGSGASPSLILKDATDETATFSKADSGYLSLTTQAADGFSVLTGNFKVGGGTPDVTLDGTNAYITGSLEVDELVTADGGLDLNEDLDVDFDAADEEVNITTSATDYAADSAVATIYASGAGQTNATYLLRLVHAADGDAQDHFLVCEDNDGDDMFKVDSGGAVTVAGTLTVTTNVDVDGVIIGDGNTEVTGTKYDVVNKTQEDTPVTLTIAESNTVLTNSGATGGLVYNLPEASTAVGMRFTFVVMAAQNLDVNPDDADQILVLTNAAGDAIRSATVGDTVTIVAIDDTNWVVEGIFPAYTDWADAN